MLNVLWVGLVVLSIIIGLFNNTTSAVVAAISSSAQQAVTISLGLVGVMALWLGIMRIAEDAGFVQFLGRLLHPILKILFPDVPAHHPAMGAITVNIAANMFGLGNAATPFGLRAMEELSTLNACPGVASNAMCTFLALNTSSLQLIPTTAIAILAANGDVNAATIIFPTLLATSCSTIAAIVAVKIFEKFPFRAKYVPELTISQ